MPIDVISRFNNGNGGVHIVIELDGKETGVLLKPREAVKFALLVLHKSLDHVPEDIESRLLALVPGPRAVFSVGETKVKVHADGGACHGTMLDKQGRCPKCGITPDMQSTELWPQDKAK